MNTVVCPLQSPTPPPPLQDIVTRYAHQTGYHVERTFGWDCHGLPVEYEIDKTLGIKVTAASEGPLLLVPVCSALFMSALFMLRWGVLCDVFH